MMDAKKIDDGGPAFPQLDVTACERDGHGDLIDPFTSASGGMSLRDWFAGQVISRFSETDVQPLDIDIAADQHDVDCALREHWSHAARTAYLVADCMIAARKSGGEA